MNILELYEKKTLHDEEFPVQLQDHNYQTKGVRFTLHWHEHLELHYVISGEAVFWVDQKQYNADSGTLIIANSNELHSGNMEAVPLVERTLIFRMDAFSKELDGQHPVFRNAIRGDSRIHELIDEIWQEQQKKCPGYKAACRALLTQLLVYLRRNYMAQTLSDEQSHRKKRELERMERVIRYIEEHYAEPISNQQLAELVYLSQSRFAHLFRDTIGVSPLQYLNEFRLKKAVSLIKGSSSSMMSIAAAVGFADYNHFGRQFKRCYGCMPSQFRSKEQQDRMSKPAEDA